MNSSLDLVPPIRGLESFSSSVFYCSGGWMMVSFFRSFEHFFSGLDEELLSRSFREIVL